MPTLLLSARHTDDSQRLWRACIAANWDVQRVHGWKVPAVLAQDVAVYGEPLLANLVAQTLDLRLLEPPLDWLPRLPKHWRGRDVRLRRLADARTVSGRALSNPPMRSVSMHECTRAVLNCRCRVFSRRIYQFSFRRSSDGRSSIAASWWIARSQQHPRIGVMERWRSPRTEPGLNVSPSFERQFNSASASFLTLRCLCPTRWSSMSASLRITVGRSWNATPPGLRARTVATRLKFCVCSDERASPNSYGNGSVHRDSSDWQIQLLPGAVSFARMCE